MKPNELRIGNYVSLQGSEFVVDSLDILVFEKARLIYYPIPLTEQWLLDFGFDHMGIIFRKSVTHHLELVYMLSINEFRIQTKGNGFTNTLDIKHVHQLQNLYFALTGEELIKKSN